MTTKNKAKIKTKDFCLKDIIKYFKKKFSFISKNIQYKLPKE